jgi:mono/diheme cytochrome c family protein
MSEDEFHRSREAGRMHAQIYPVTVTGTLPPIEPFRRFIEEPSPSPLRSALRGIFKELLDLRSTEQIFSLVGLHSYPRESDQGVYSVPYPEGRRPTHPMGVGIIERGGAKGFTLSCAACHSANLFGKTVLGMTNRFPRANEFFLLAKWSSHFYRPGLFRRVTGATAEEQALMEQTLRNLKSVGVKKPLTLGLDTSLAQVALSLSRRNSDAIASKNPRWEKKPRADLLDHQPADSKPAVWWNLKYKNRWLSDGSVVSGNPVFTNILWNEIGRGADLGEIRDWLAQNQQIIKELTTAVFSSEAPRITDFFPAEQIDLPTAQAGQKVFLQSCARCHGVYEKAWDQGVALSPQDMLRTTLVRYHAKTPVINVGTDPMRRLGMVSLERLNDLEISKQNGTLIRSQGGYVPPPLVGIWARWPYFHNNSAPNLCAVLTAGPKRPAKYYSGDALNPQKDFDFNCNGYPQGKKTPVSWKTNGHLYDSQKAGLGRLGHDEGIFLKKGKEIFSPAQKMALIQFLQTL